MKKLADSLATLVDRDAPVPTALGLAALLPLLVLALLILADVSPPFDRDTIARVMVGYGALLLSFLGGVRWGMTMRLSMGRREAATLAASLAPMLVGWIALFLPAGPALGLLAVAYAGQGAWDVWTIEAGYGPPWYGRLRVQFTLVVTAILAAALMLLGA